MVKITDMRISFTCIEDAVAAKTQILDYQLKHNQFSSTNISMWIAAKTMPSYKWWFQYGAGAPQQKKFAQRLLAVATSGSSMERTWSSFEFIHNRPRNRLTVNRSNSLASIFSNMLLRKMEREAANWDQDSSIPWRLFDDPAPIVEYADPDEFEHALLVDINDDNDELPTVLNDDL
ncbi:hypothetical protein CEUSTIGMA_g3085.t1 [Chlamydomonas eustigma]|uniref:HAT C-terminal dimerisation domain-containing protein n=1 Tax=Chlamydomonas eustigma TaxID=1157962 RepID=A0A250WXU3_9CHLO|nr:hypothetical protein CEUSTIGMA_g3085.t1 [Chlamydomonas eustigma]|eukprot:GAX75641.1 hypothetical protein CEUSTIGMA_g3085.t1 [Chlamydomonas eustigma]